MILSMNVLIDDSVYSNSHMSRLDIQVVSMFADLPA